MKPYYEHAGISIYHGDCREVLPEVQDVDLVLTDPPYGVGFEYTRAYDDDPTRYKNWIAQAFYAARAKAPTLLITTGMKNSGCIRRQIGCCVGQSLEAHAHRH